MAEHSVLESTRAIQTGFPADPTRRGQRARRKVDSALWLSFAGQRLLRLAISVAIIVLLSFLMIRMVPGDPIRAALGAQASPELVARLRAENGLDGSLFEQARTFLSGLLVGDLGTSFTVQLPVADVILSRLPVTLALAAGGLLVAVLLALLLGFPVAMLTSGGRRRRLRGAFVATTGLIGTVPEFILSIAFVFLFAITLGWLPSAGADGPSAFVLPILALACGPAAVLSRTLRVEVSRVLGEDYVLIARSKHLGRWRLALRHVLPNAAVAAMTLSVLLLASLIGGAVLVETVFAMPGLGMTVVSAVINRDYPLVQGIIMFLGIFVVVVMTLLDTLLAVIDPRRLQGGAAR